MILTIAIAYAVALGLAYACIIAGSAADTLDNTTDKGAEEGGRIPPNFRDIGGGYFIEYPVNHGERN